MDYKEALKFVEQRVEADGRKIESIDVSAYRDGWSIFINYVEPTEVVETDDGMQFPIFPVDPPFLG